MINHKTSTSLRCEYCSSEMYFSYPVFGIYTCSECNKKWQENGSKMVKCKCSESCTEYLRAPIEINN